VIRSLAPDELSWFLSRYYSFLGHSDPRGLARRVLEHARDLDHEAVRSFIYMDDGSRQVKAGVNLLAPKADEDDQNLYLSNLWFEEQAADLQFLVSRLLSRHHHEAAHVPLYNFSEAHTAALSEVFIPLGFRHIEVCELEFELADLPPLGLPLVLEAWTHESDALFRSVLEQAEQKTLSDSAWAYLKRWRSAFYPDLWFILRETLDQEPVGYAFFGAERTGIEGIYHLSKAGAMQEFRYSSEMLRRLVLSGLHELAARSPLGRVRTALNTDDQKLVRIFELLGFDTLRRHHQFTKEPQ
jgi:hypothetical protein